ncbi:MAG: AIR synthase family protein [Caldilineaceae bacterium]|nr:AIR synthase family protein [Caldilineaceae bacterium]
MSLLDSHMPPSTDLAPLAAGKLPVPLLAELLAGLPTHDPQLILGPGVGEDAAVIDFTPGSAHLLVAKSDPITFATDAIGYYAVNVCANDLAVTGATPRFYLPTLLLPAGEADVGMARAIFDQIGAACLQLGIVVAGGHSEVTHTVTQPVVAGTMLGQVRRGQEISSQGCRPGDLVLMAGVAPVEGASLIARERRADLLGRGWDEAELARAANFLHDPGISVLVPALLAATQGVSAMHDPTEGGVATGLLELALAAQVGLEIDLDAIPIAPPAARLCAEFGLDPLGTIASGALLAACPPDRAETILAGWRAQGWPGCVIGRATSRGAALVARRGGHAVPFPAFAADEITKLWG